MVVFGGQELPSSKAVEVAAAHQRYSTGTWRERRFFPDINPDTWRDQGAVLPHLVPQQSVVDKHAVQAVAKDLVH